jgi:hypothetical protein
MSEGVSPEHSPSKEDPSSVQAPESPQDRSPGHSPQHSPMKEEEEEDIPEEEYQMLVQAMEIRKQEDEQNKVEGREHIDYVVPRRRKKVKEAVEQKNDIDPMLVEWTKEKLETLGGFDENKHWTPELEDVVRKFMKDSAFTKLFVWSEREHIKHSLSDPPAVESDEEFIFFLKCSLEPVTLQSVNNVLFYKKVQSNYLKSLLSVMNAHFIPKLVKDGSWPDNVKKEFLAQLHKFMSGVTETCYEMEGYT